MDANTIRIALQVIAALFGLALAVLLVRGLRHGLARGIVPLQLFAIPILGFVFFVLNPFVLAPPPGIVWVLIAPLIVIVAVLPLWWRRHAGQVQAAVTTPAMLTLQTRVGVILVACIVLMLSTYLFLFEPVLAVLNVIAYLVWVLVWIPRSLRKHSAEVSIDVAASPARVWDYLMDISNWLRYSVDLEDIKASPPGPLEVGTQITSRRRVPLIGSPRKVSELKMEFRSAVTEMLPRVSFTMAALDRQATTKTEMTATSSGSRITMHTQFVLSVEDGIAGYAFRWPVALSQFKATSTRSLERLSELLSS